MADNPDVKNPTSMSEMPDLDVVKQWQGEMVYFNGFTNILGTGDIALVLRRNDKPVAVMNTSYTVAKTLAVKLMELVKTLENKTGTTIMTTDQITESLTGKTSGNKH